MNDRPARIADSAAPRADSYLPGWPDLRSANPTKDITMDSYFLKMDGVPGESVDPRHTNEIDVLSFTWGVANAGTRGAGGNAAGRAQPGELRVAMRTNSASPLLFAAAASGKHLPAATLTVVRAGGRPVEYLSYTLGDVYVSSHTAETDDEHHVIEHIGLVYATLTIRYRPQQPDGSPGGPIEAGWDFRSNKSM